MGWAGRGNRGGTEGADARAGAVTGLMAPQAERPYPPERALSVPISLNGYA
ncbi:hypothetical protein GCM10010287_65260 [Streptomyces variabilis]|uniref:Uncharacterized protein n=1 Tax=Streptomyces variabilis TaxID=67372 RepID=A0ABQ2U8N0_9ACTN|nr:hypothetical protein GCM10010265_65070 [Streptomyces griseoincarnatus]GGT81856.1 hypothetical protein GCM10010287_65260 [Streptomyces variabilis]